MGPWKTVIEVIRINCAGKIQGATSRSLREIEEIRGSFKVMTFFLSSLVFWVNCIAPQVFFGCYSYVSPNGTHQNFRSD